MEVDNDSRNDEAAALALPEAGPSRSPLALDLRQRCSILLEDLGVTADQQQLGQLPIESLRIVSEFANSTASYDGTPELLTGLTALCAVEGVSASVCHAFGPILLDLLARWLDDRSPEVETMEARLSALASVASLRPDIWSLVYSFIYSSPFRQSPLCFVQNVQSAPTERIHGLLLAYIRLLTADPGLSTRLSWSNSPLMELRQHPDAGVRLLAVQVLSKQKDLSEVGRMELEREWVGEVGTIEAEVDYGLELVQGVNGSQLVKRMVDGWLLPIHEGRREKAYLSREPIADLETSNVIDSTYLSDRTILLGNSLCLRADLGPSAESFIHVPTASSSTGLSRLVPALQLGLPIMLSSSPSSGKTHMLQYLSTQLYPSLHPTHRILTIPLADTSIDVKSLIGTYISSTTKPGTFEWMEGALTKAVRAGRWVVFDDIDRASTEMLVTIAGITRSLRSGRPGRRTELPIPGRGKVEAGDGFAVFATRSTSLDGYTPASFLGHQEFQEVVLEAPSDQEIYSILSARFATLPTEVITPLVSIWQQLRPLAKISGQVKARSIGLRDLEKWCARIVRSNPPASSSAGPFANPAFQDEIMLEAADIFVASLDTKASSSDKKIKMVKVIADGIGMDEERALSLLERRKPSLELAPSSRQLLIGRTVTPTAAPEKRRSNPAPPRPFALTKPSLVLLERIAAGIATAEPLLLVGETGTGKTTAVQYIADTCRKPLTALNLSMQTESSDLLGGFKPIDASVAARSIHAKWQTLFCESFSMGKSTNGAYVEAAAKALAGRKWARCADLWSTSAKRAVDKLSKPEQNTENGSDSPRKRRKVANTKAAKLAVQWQSLLVEVADFDLHHVKMKSKLVFSFVEGPLVKALTAGEWILLDEVNLASQETLEAIATILEGASSSLVLTERGDVEPIIRHPDFRLFACMNPATDVGKKDLPPNLRNRFTELYVPPPDDDRDALITIVSQYINDAAAGDKGVILDVVEMYTTLKRLSSGKEIVDGSNIAPHFSMRTLARALVFAVDTAPLFGLRRGLWEGCLMAFTMSLDLASAKKAHEVCERHILTPMKNARAVLGQIPSLPAHADPDDHIRFGPFWLRRGPLPPDTNDSRYVITPSVQAKLSDLARVILTHRYPVLIQGPTSAGKTSAVEFLARQTGHRFVRINNHEHTDIQEYLGTYVTDPKTGNLVFQEGLLVTAVRQGHWIVLDELNLAPTDVLEALNRLLDDNRELVIPETQEVIRPHPNFILFATQNPPGLYAGRKVLSRAFRNRFLEVHFDDVPKDELETILCQRCQIAPPYAKKIVQVFEELRHRRQATRVFEAKSSFATLRDLFRWAERGAIGYQQLAEDGYMLLAERARQDEDKVVIKQVIEEILKVTVDETKIYRVVENPTESILARLPFNTMPSSKLVWTRAMQRLFALVAFALAHNEPVLLVGETGCGKTSVCEVIARAFNQQLVGVNCHQNMETADLLGSQRPVRNRHERKAKVLATISQYTPIDPSASDDEIMAACENLRKQSDVDGSSIAACQSELKALNALFEWSDGPLVHAMHAGDLLLLDEVSLADDSVLERLNSVLEPGRTLVLAEKGGTDIDEATLRAHDSFHVVATMNPGGDFGKKELSPALRNRFTEIWVPPLDDKLDLLHIIDSTWKYDELRQCGARILDFFEWFGKRIGDTAGMGLRDIIAWVTFSNSIYGQGGRQVAEAFHHGGQMVIVDGLESLSQVNGSSAASVATLRQECMDLLSKLASSLGGELPKVDIAVILDESALSIGGFGIPRGPCQAADTSAFRFEAPTTALNAMRVLRGCQLPKAILLEGSPGVGKTSLVSALAAVSGHLLQRINLSDQTDLIDLFGSDLPVEGGQAGEFQWRDAAFLDAMQKGDWVLLDEMNLASQTVLEGLNAVLDHRGTVFIPELGRSFDRHPDFRVFAAQNPLQQGGGRKGLPKSFLNRFTKVYLQEHTPEDLLMICRHLYPSNLEMVQKMIRFNEIIRDSTMVSRTIGREGSPWEFNLRDLFRWFKLLIARNGLELSQDPVEYLRIVYTQRFRNDKDRHAVIRAFASVFGESERTDYPRPQSTITPSHFQVGHSLVARSRHTSVDHSIIHPHLGLAESVLKCIEIGWLVILSGESGAGKRGLLRAIADGAGRHLGEFAMHPGVDTSEILGSFEQQDVGRMVDDVLGAVLELLRQLSLDPAVENAIEKLATSAATVKSTPENTDVLRAFVDLVRKIVSQLENADTSKAAAAVDHLSKSGTNATGFAWIDGELLTAIRTGGWFVLSNANLCSPSVLDRLNSLCESNGVLVLSEKGSSTGTPEIITPHPEFRLFMTYDPRHGELSRAMRNRGVELCVEKPIEVTGQPSMSALANHALLRSLARVHGSDQESWSASQLANHIVSQSAESVAVLARFGKLDKHAQAYEAALRFAMDASVSVPRSADVAVLDSSYSLPIDPSTNGNIPTAHAYAIFGAVQLLLRNLYRSQELHNFLAQPEHAKSILTLSSRTTSGRERVKMAGSEMWSLVSGLRSIISDSLPEILGFRSRTYSTTRMEALEALMVLLTLLETRNSGDVFDYSSTQLLAEWMQSSLATLPALNAIGDLLSVVARAVQLSTGQGQSQIWSLFRDGSRHALDSDTYAPVLARLASVSDTKLRKSIAEAISAAEATDEEGLSKLNETLGSLAAQAPPETDHNEQWSNQTVLGAIELQAITKPTAANLDLLISDPTISLRHAAILHSAGKTQPRPAVILTAINNMLARQWSTIDYNSEGQTGQGPSDLFRPARLSSVLRFGGAQNVRLGDLPEEQRSFKFTVDMVLWNSKNAIDSRSSLLNMFATVLGMLCTAFGRPIDLAGDATSAVEQLSSLPASPLKDALHQHILPLLSNSDGMRDLSSMGRLWLGLSRTLIELYVTDIPIDPAVRRVLLGDVITAKLSLLEEELAAVEEAELQVKGISDSARRQSLLNRVAAVMADKETLGPAIERPTDVSRLAILFNEIHSYMGDAFSTSATESLLEALASGNTQALERERGFQLSAVAFARRLSENYRDLKDLVAPITTAVLFARFGMRLLARHLDLQNKTPLESVPNIMRFPQSAAVAKFAQMAPSSPMSKEVLRDQFLAATALSVDANSPTQRVHHVPLLVDTLNQLYSSWSEIRQREQQDEQASESLYRVKKTDIEVKSDEELLEQEFAKMFPTYEEDEDEEVDPEPSKSDDHTVKFDTEAVLTFHQLLMSAFGTGVSVIDFRSTTDKLLATDFDASAYDESLDNQSLPLQIRHLHQRLKSLQPVKSHPNFYLEANEPQVRRAHALILRVIARLDQLIADWPDQMVPQHIKDRCLEILRLHTRSPVAKVLTSLEQLLLHFNDWEGYANKENSLASYQSEISDLIVEWRRLELSSWMRLLDDQVEEYVNNDTEWTMRLFGALIQGVQTAEDVQAHLASTLPMISSYLSASTLGHFDSRVETLKALGKMADEMAQIAEYPHFKQTALLIHNIAENASLFLPRLNDSLNTQRAVIDKAIKDFVKLASWKDVNVYALKASAVKSHRQLHRNVRKFREVLRQRVEPILMDHNSICPQESSSASPRGVIPPTFDFMTLSVEAVVARQAVQPAPPAHLARLEDTLKRYHTIHEQVRSTLQISGADSVDEMAVEIIETAAELAKATPETLTKENTKLVNNLASRKRKAYSDMLKALRASGFSNSVRADQLSKQQSSTWMAGLAGLPLLPDGVDTNNIRKVESYHHRLNVLMITLRAAFNGHNPDIASSDLERGIGYSESIFATAVVQRQKLSGDLNTFVRLINIVKRLVHCSQSSSLRGGRSVRQNPIDAELHMIKIIAAIDEIAEGVTQLQELDATVVFEGSVELQQHRARLSSLLHHIKVVNTQVRLSGAAVYTEVECQLLYNYSSERSAVLASLAGWQDRCVQFRHLLNPVHIMIEAMGIEQLESGSLELPDTVWIESDDLIQSMLVVTQGIKATSPEQKEDEATHVPSHFAALNSTANSLRVTGILDKLDNFVGSLASQPGLISPDVLSRVLPFVQDLAESYSHIVYARSYNLKSTYKLGYVVARLVLDLAQKGFCKPQEESDSKDDNAGGETVDGTGMGAGTGDKNVSSEIEEEGQVEGLQGEKEEDGPEEDKEKEDDAVSMDEDFEGDLGDAKKDKDDDGEGSEGDEEERDDHVGDVDPLDPGAVDEKFWGDEEKEEQKDDGKEDLMNQKDEGGESEMAAKESEGEKKDKDDKKQDEQKEGEQQDRDQNEAEEGQQDLDDFDKDDDTMDNDDNNEGDERDEGGVQDQDDVVAPEGDRLDLPDDMDLGDDGQDDDGLGEEIDDLSMKGDDEGEEAEPSDAGQASDDDGAQEDDAPAATGAAEEEANEADDTLNPNVDTSAANDNQAQQSAEAGAGLDGGDDQQGQDKEDVDMPENEEPAEGEGSAPQDQQGASSTDQQEADGPVDSAGAPMPASSNDRTDRSLGDILQEIQRRRDEILAQQERDNETSDTNAPEQAPGQVEYLHQGDQDEGLQALGAAGEEERQRLEDLNIVDEEAQEAEETANMDDSEAEEPTRVQDRDPDVSVKTEADTERQAIEKALTQSEVRGDGPDVSRSEDELDLDMEDVPATVDVKEEEIDDIEIEIKDGEGVVGSNNDGEDLWRKYASLTSDLSYALCEQLRLILEPTLATRLQGDFRTGKRLNMRKIIPYIASEYTKDKIWLRRTKPSRREYQVLLSLDDSRSMAESQSVNLAYQTLALVSQALNKLEVGQISIARFGESVDILHPFGDTGFTDADGAKVMDSFKFDQHRTDVAALVERSLTFLAEARQRQASSSSAPDLWQLQVIISDGICQDHQRLRTLLRRALEERVMIVFVIVDSLHRSQAAPQAGGASSILSMQTVEYKQVNGTMQLEMQRYLDTFPFEFYVVLRDVEALPGVLADTLRQWMTRVSQSNE